MRRAMGNAQRLGVQGIKIMSSGRLNGQDIARTEWYREGRVPLQTLKNDIDYGFAQAKTKMGVVGIKVWISNGDTVVVSKRAKYSLESDPVADEPLPLRIRRRSRRVRRRLRNLRRWLLRRPRPLRCARAVRRCARVSG